MSKLEFSEQEKRKAAEQVTGMDVRYKTGWTIYWCDAIDLQCRLNRAEKLIGRLLGEVCGPFADTTVVPESEVFLTALREERGEQ